MISKKVMADIYVLGVRVLNWIISKFYRTLATTKKEFDTSRTPSIYFT